jgi:cholesterol oxidase
MYDAIVIGSGFGGAVTAAKLTTNGAKVRVLEKGHRWRNPQSGDPSENIHLGAPIANLVDDQGFPRAADDSDRWGNPNYVLRQSTDPKYVLFSNPRNGVRSGGLYEDYIGDNFFVSVARGYGGGSLVYSLVHLRAPSETFHQSWWSALPFNRAILDPYYQRVEQALTTYQLSWGEVPRRGAVVANAMARLGITCEPARLGNYRIAMDSDRGLPPVPNSSGRPTEPCNGCGFCAYGCIFNAAQTLALTYLAQAEDTGRLYVRTDALAYAIEPIGRKYRVHWYDYRAERWNQDDGRAVVIAAGAVNSPELLLRCRDVHRSLPDLSAHVGRHVSANGNASFTALFPNLPAEFKVDIYKGPVSSIVSYQWWASHRFIIEDLGTAPLGVARFPVRREGGDGRYWGEQVKGLLRAHYAGEIVGLTGMGIDNPDGRVSLDSNGNATLQWTQPLVQGDRTYHLIENIRLATAGIAQAGDGELLHDKEWSDNRRLTTVDPLGGCRMATRIEDGVVDENGAVFGYPGLFVVDGSIMPGAIGVNPSLTIAAMAENLSDGIVTWLRER